MYSIVIIVISIFVAVLSILNFENSSEIENVQADFFDFSVDSSDFIHLDSFRLSKFGAIERTRHNRLDASIALRNTHILRKLLLFANHTEGPNIVHITKAYTIFSVRIGVECLYSATFTRDRIHTCRRTVERIGLVNVTLIIDGSIHAFEDPLSKHWDKVNNDDQDKNKHVNNDRAILMFYQCKFFTITSTIKRPGYFPAMQMQSFWRPNSLLSIFTLGLSHWLVPIPKMDGDQGIIDGHGWHWWTNVIFGKGEDYRPHLISLQGENIRVENLWLRNSPQWTVRMFDTLNSSVDFVRIEQIAYPPSELYSWNAPSLATFFAYILNAPTLPLNTDGIDPAGQNITISNMWYYGYDDAIAVKPGTKRTSKDRFGFDSGCTRNIFIENITAITSVGIAIGSIWPTEAHTCIENVFVKNAEFQNPIKAIYIKVNPDKEGTASSGHISNIHYENIRVKNCLQKPIYIGPQQQRQPGTQGIGCHVGSHSDSCFSSNQIQVRDVILKNVLVEGTIVAPGTIVGSENLKSDILTGAGLERLTFINVTASMHFTHPFVKLFVGGDDYTTTYCKECIAYNSHPCPASFECKQEQPTEIQKQGAMF